jgi:hypothetical protein
MARLYRVSGLSTHLDNYVEKKVFHTDILTGNQQYMVLSMREKLFLDYIFFGSEGHLSLLLQGVNIRP